MSSPATEVSDSSALMAEAESAKVQFSDSVIWEVKMKIVHPKLEELQKTRASRGAQTQIPRLKALWD